MMWLGFRAGYIETLYGAQLRIKENEWGWERGVEEMINIHGSVGGLSAAVTPSSRKIHTHSTCQNGPSQHEETSPVWACLWATSADLCFTCSGQ